MSFTGTKDSAAYDVCITGAPQLAQADELWAPIDPPSVGRHTINLTLAYPAIGAIDGTWVLNVAR